MSRRTAREVVVVSTSRADLGPLSSVMTLLQRTPGVELTIWTGVAFDEAGLRAAAAQEGVALSSTVEVQVLAEPVDLRATVDAATAGVALSAGTAHVLRLGRPSVVVVLGDRWELLHITPAVVLAGVPLVHLHGGEVTAGAIDERVRHAVTKLADEHCVADADSAARVRMMGEPADAVHLTGAPGRDRLREVEPFEPEEFRRRFGVPLRRPLLTCTLHPETAGKVDNAALARTVLQAVLSIAGTTVVTHPGQDLGREDILQEIRAIQDRDDVVVVVSLGREYPRLLVSSDAVVGNSSSGVIEAPAAAVPSVNVGDRQLGRAGGPGVVHCGLADLEVRQALARALEPRTRQLAETARKAPPAAPAVVEVVLAAAARGPRRKAFNDPEEDPGVRPADPTARSTTSGGAA